MIRSSRQEAHSDRWARASGADAPPAELDRESGGGQGPFALGRPAAPKSFFQSRSLSSAICIVMPGPRRFRARVPNSSCQIFVHLLPEFLQRPGLLLPDRFRRDAEDACNLFVGRVVDEEELQEEAVLRRKLRQVVLESGGLGRRD